MVLGAVYHVGGRIAEGVAVARISPRHVIGAEFREFVAGQPQNVCAGIQGYKIHMWCPSKYT